MPVLTQPTVFERDDRIYFVSPVVQAFTPTTAQIDELAFASQVKKTSPNENIKWLRGQYVEADHPNRNNAHWTTKELALKSLTPMLMPVTVMHDPRTAVGTIADVKLLTPERDQVARARIDDVLALWAHRFPEVVEEADANMRQNTLMQSMEAFTPAYECSACGQVFYKQAGGAEQAMWCDHLKLGAEIARSGAQPTELQTAGWRTLLDVCFTGTGLIFGTRGAVGAYTEAHLSDFADEVAEYHQRVHTDTARTARSTRMALIQIEESELKLLRDERDAARKATDDEKAAHQETQRKIEETEVRVKAVEKEREDAKQETARLQETVDQAALGDKRWNELGNKFVNGLGDFTKGRLQEQAKSLSDQEWDNRLKEVEESSKLTRDAKDDGAPNESATTTTTTTTKSGEGSPTFTEEELARLTNGVGGGGQPTSTNGEYQTGADRRSVAAGLSKAFAKKS